MHNHSHIIEIKGPSHNRQRMSMNETEIFMERESGVLRERGRGRGLMLERGPEGTQNWHICHREATRNSFIHLPQTNNRS